MILARGLSKRFGAKRVLEGLDFDLEVFNAGDYERAVKKSLRK